MTEAGQIFALLRSTSAAEIAKRFNMPSDNAPVPASSSGDVAIGLGGAPSGNGATGARPGHTQGALAAALAQLGGTGVDEAGHAADSPAQSSGGTVRPAASLAHLAPPRADIVRLFADSLMSGLPKPGASMASGGAMLSPGPSGQAGFGQAPGSSQGHGPGLGFAGTGAASDVQAVLSATLDAASDIDLTSSTGGRGADSLVAGGGAGQAGGAGGAARSAADAAAATSLDRAIAAETANNSAQAGLTGTAASARGALAAGGMGAAQVAAFVEGVTAMLDPAAAGRAGTVASGVIFNAAMIPGWPFPSAMARDGAEAINSKALLHRLAAAMEGMTPQQAAEYMAKVGGGHVLLRNLRKILKELDMIGKDEVKGLLVAFLETISSIATGLQTALAQLTESAALQATVVHGEDPDDGERPGRRRLRL